MIRRLLLQIGPLLIALAISTLMVLHSYAGFGGSESYVFRPAFAISIALVGCLISLLLSGGLSYVHKALGREIAGAAALVLALYGMMAVCLLTPIGKSLRPWEFAVIPACWFTFFLHSQRSFLIHLSINSTILLVAQIALPSLPAMMALMALALLLFVFLNYREKKTTCPDGKRIKPHVLRGAPLPILGVLGVLAALTLIKPPRPPDALIDEPGPGQRTSSLPWRAMQDMPLRPIGSPFTNQAAGALEDQMLVKFDQDLKFGNQATAPGPGQDDVIVMLVRLRDSEGVSILPHEMPRYWKIGVLHRYTGNSWVGPDRPTQIVRDEDDAQKDGVVRFNLHKTGVDMFVEQTYVVSPLASKALPAIYPVYSITLPQVALDEEKVLSRPALFKGRFKYLVVSFPPLPSRNDLLLATARHYEPRYTEIPMSVANDSAFKAAVHAISPDLNQVDTIESTMVYLGKFQYTLTPNLDDSRDPTLEFLRKRKGYCQHFASALCLMLRHFKIPARVAVGFAAGDWDERERIYIVRRRHAHSWVEVYFEGIGWIPYDPTSVLQTESPMVQTSTPEPLPPWQSKDLPRYGQTPGEPPVVRRPTDRWPPDNLRSKPGVEKPDNPKDSSNPARSAEDPSKPSPAERRPPAPVGPTEFDKLLSSVENRAPDPAKRSDLEEPPHEEQRPVAHPPAAPAPSSFAGHLLLRDAGVIVGLLLAVFGVAWFLRPRRTTPAVDEPEAGAEVSSEETRPPLFLRTLHPVRGTSQYRLVRLYANLLKRLTPFGFARRSSQTPFEFAAIVGTPAMSELTSLFVRARYSDTATTPSDVQHASRVAEQVLKEMRGRIP